MPVDASAAIAALDELMVLLDAATHDGVSEGADMVQRIARAGVPETSGRGSGQLAASIMVTGPGPTGAASYVAKVGPTTVYGRIREIGGAIPGRKGMTHPFLRWEANGRVYYAREVHQHGAKYLLHAVETVRPQFPNIMVKRWRRAIESV